MLRVSGGVLAGIGAAGPGGLIRLMQRSFAAAKIIAAAVCVTVVAACGPTDLAHRSILEPFPAATADFEQHRNAVSGYLGRNRVAIDAAAAADEIALNAPFERIAAESVPYRGKFLLIHGLNDSPFIWRDLADRLSREGFDVRAILLPGHGSRPGAMLDVRYEDWLAVLRGHLEGWKTDAAPIYLGGFSLGGVVATALALEDDTVAGLLLFAPAWRSDSEDILKWSSVVALARDWAFTGPQINPVRYGSIPVNAGTQYYEITQYLMDLWRGRTLEIPVLVVVTTEDSVVDVEYVREIFRDRFPAPGNRLVIYSANGAVPRDGREIVRDGADPARRILNRSHMGLMIAPENPRYGETGDIIVCNGGGETARASCRSAPLLWHGAWGTSSPDGAPVARTTYNPDFEFLIQTARMVF